MIHGCRKTSNKIDDNEKRKRKSVESMYLKLFLKMNVNSFQTKTIGIWVVVDWNMPLCRKSIALAHPKDWQKVVISSHYKKPLRVYKGKIWEQMFCRSGDTRKVWSSSGFECEHGDLICPQTPWDKGCICMVVHLKYKIKLFIIAITLFSLFIRLVFFIDIIWYKSMPTKMRFRP